MLQIIVNNARPISALPISLFSTALGKYKATKNTFAVGQGSSFADKITAMQNGEIFLNSVS
jgi:hypothetical protein